MSLVTPDDLRNHMNGIEFGADQQKAVEAVLAGLQSQLERFLRRPIEIRSFTRTARVDRGTGLFWTHTPLVSVTEIVTAASDAIDPVNYTSPPLRMLGGYGYSEDITVTYTAGLDGHSDEYADLRLLILDAGSRGVTHRHDNTISVRGGTEGAVQEKDREVDPNEIRFTQDELDTVLWMQRKSVY